MAINKKAQKAAVTALFILLILLFIVDFTKSGIQNQASTTASTTIQKNQTTNNTNSSSSQYLSFAWKNGTDYPVNDSALSCVSINASITCIGGGYGELGSYKLVYSTSLSPEGLTGSWSSEADYPRNMNYGACTSYNYTIYCMGGRNINSSDYLWGANYSANYSYANQSNNASVYVVARHMNLTYYANDYSGAVGQWRTGAAYPYGFALQSCPNYGPSVYCIGGEFLYNSTNYINRTVSTGVYFNKNPSNMSSAWSIAEPYPIPIDTESCVVIANKLYCMGGSTSYNGFTGNTNDVFYSTIFQSGFISNWTQLKSLPVNVSQTSCTSYKEFIICIGGLTTKLFPVYYNLRNISFEVYSNKVMVARLIHNGTEISNWTVSNYTIPIGVESCTTNNITLNNTYITCVTGYTDKVLNPNYSNVNFYATNKVFYSKLKLT